MEKKVLVKVVFFYPFVFSGTFTIHRTTGEEEAISLTSLYHFHPFHRNLDISQVIIAESLPLTREVAV